MKNNKKATSNSALLPAYLWIISYLKAYGWKLALLTITIIIINSCEVAIPKFIQVFIDQIVGEKDFEGHPVGETFALFNNNVNSIHGIYHEHFPNTINLLFTTLLPFLMIVSSRNLWLSIIIIVCYLAYCITSPLLKSWVDVITL